jgi:hypothetical protein
MKSFVLGALASITSAFEINEFLLYSASYGKSYSSMEDFQFRMSIFAETSKEIDEINASQSDHVAGHNQFSDFTHQEY